LVAAIQCFSVDSRRAVVADCRSLLGAINISLIWDRWPSQPLLLLSLPLPSVELAFCDLNTLDPLGLLASRSCTHVLRAPVTPVPD
jgi:hypothetical protein